MSDATPLAGLVQFTAGTLRQLAQAYADAVDKDDERYQTEIPERVKRLYVLRPDLASYPVRFLGIPLGDETVFHADGKIQRPECDDWGWKADRRKVAVKRACSLPGYRPRSQYLTGHAWLLRLKGLNDNSPVFINADDSGILTAGYTPFPDFSEEQAKQTTRID